MSPENQNLRGVGAEGGEEGLEFGLEKDGMGSRTKEDQREAALVRRKKGWKHEEHE